TDVRARAFVERYLHLAIEEIIDTANPIVSFHQWREPAGYRDLMRILLEKEFHFRPRRPAGYLAWVVYGKPRKPLALFYQFGERVHIIKHLDRLIARGEVASYGEISERV
ncbi:MAG: hypothetical protein K9K82_09710, partial [Desulfobacteraceae bacterium]|nr:hypothetical protein [Desulfobacteraceae bacterium]